MVTREEILFKIKKAKSDIGNKRTQIRGAKKRTDFKGVRIQDQFDVGRQGIKTFRKSGKLKRKQGFFDLGIFKGELPGLRNSLMIAEKDLEDFDLLGGG